MARGRGSNGGARGNPGRTRQSLRPNNVLPGRTRQSLRPNNVLPSSPASNRPGQNACCGLCSVEVGDDAVGCDRCDRWYHSSVMCMGIPEGVIDNIKQYGGEGISYICTVCHSSSSAGGDSQGSALGQLLQTVAKLCETVQSLSDRVDSLLSGSTRPVLPLSNSDQLSVLIGEECRELEERRKRVSSIIIRGITADTPAAMRPIFDAVSSELVGSPVVLKDIVCIDASKGLFRAKVEDDEKRRRLLDSAKNLKNSSQYSNVYVNRDLTFKQRQTLMTRRLRSRDHNLNVSTASGTAAGPGNSQTLAGESSGSQRGCPGGAVRPETSLN